MDVFQAISPANFLPATIAGDVSFLLVFIAVCLALGLYLGRSQLVSVVMYGYIGVALLTVLPADVFAFSLYSKAIIFAGIFFFLFFVGDYVLDIHIPNAGADFFWRILIMSFLAVGMLTSIIFALLPKADLLQYLSRTSLTYFISPNAQIAWMIIPLFFLLFINKRLR
ncbi:MAG: hypothetical protein PHT88_04540 [Candidatus Moranbacteria bacterium]|nr:hypothetical protein [Candidatus Moranbacteria bacterium]